MALPKYCDERAEKFFTRRFVGEKHGEDGTSSKVSWDSTSGAKATRVHVSGYKQICVYCGNPAFPIQRQVGRGFDSDYIDKGHCCVCKDAMDEIEWEEERQAIIERHTTESNEHDKKCPKMNGDVIVALLVQRTEEMTKNVVNGTIRITTHERLALRELDLNLAYTLPGMKDDD